MSRKIIFYTILIACLYLGYATVKMYLADVFSEASSDVLTNGDYVKAIKYADYSVQFNPNEPNYYRGRARAYLISTIVKKDEDQILYYKLSALADMKKALNLNKYNLATIRNLVPLYSYLATKDITKPASTQNVDEVFISYTKDFYDYAYNYSPNDAGVYALLAKYQKRLGLWDDYQKSIEKINTLRPDLLEWYLTE